MLQLYGTVFRVIYVTTHTMVLFIKTNLEQGAFSSRRIVYHIVISSAMEIVVSLVVRAPRNIPALGCGS